MLQPRQLVLRLAVVGALIGLLVASVSWAGAQSGNTAGVRFVHVGIDTPPVNVDVDGETVAESLFWLEATDYLDVAAGDIEISIFDPDTSLDEALSSATVTTEAGTNYSAVISGQLPTPSIVLIADGGTGPIDAGMGGLRFFNSVPDSGAIDLVASDGTMIVQGVAAETVSAYVMVPAGSYDFEFFEAGTENSLYVEEGATVEEGVYQTVYLSGFADPGNFAAETFIDESSDTGGGGEPTATEADTTATEAEATGTGDATTTETAAATEVPPTETLEPTATPEPTATSTPEAPTVMPATGAGGTADGGGTNTVLFGTLAMLLMAAGGGLFFWSRRTA